MKLFASAFAMTAVALFAQVPNTSNSQAQSGFSVPSLGFVAGPGPQQLRPILGIPGAARLGRPIPLPQTVSRIYIAPGHGYALVQQGPNDPISVVSLRDVGSVNLTLMPIAGAAAQADVIAFSPTARSAGFYSHQTNQLQIVTGLPSSPQIHLNISNLSIPAALQKFAVSDDAQNVLLADATGGVYSLSQSSTPALVYHSSEITAIEFVAQSHDAVICDRTLKSAILLRGASITPIMQAGDGTCEPEAAASTSDGRTILLACPAQHAVLSIDRTSGFTTKHSLANTPGALERLGTRDAFLMTPADDHGTYWLFVWQPQGPATFFVAASRDLKQ